MIKIPYEEVVKRLREKAGISEEEIEKKVQAKIEQLSGLVSKEGAAYILANELGIKLVENSGKIKDIFPGMRNVETVGKVTHVFEVREFQRKDGSQSKVGAFVIGDETGTIRVAAWGSQADNVTRLEPGMAVKLTGAYSRENNGNKELHLNDNSGFILNPPGVEIEVATSSKAERKPIKDLTQDLPSAEIVGTVVQVFEPRYFEVCPQCNSRLKLFQEKWVCDTHKETEPDYSYVLNAYVDDGTDSIRVVFFRQQAENLLSRTKEQMVEMKTHPEQFEPLKTELLGEQFKIVGRPKHNQFFDRLELVANSVEKANPEEEKARLTQQS